MFKKVAWMGVVIGMLLVPVFASADVISDLQAEVQRLVAQIAALQAQQTSSTTPPSAGATDDYPSTSSPTTCPTLTVTMQRGSRDATTGGQVSELQIFLANHFNLNEDDVVTGYFGPTTHRYVVKFQTANNLPAYGIVGSLTRAAITQECSRGMSSTIGSQSGSSKQDMTASSPVSNAASQVQIQDISVGTGTVATLGSNVSVFYTGKLGDGTVFDSSAAHGNQPLMFILGAQGLIPGFQTAVTGMKVGGERLATIPSNLGYGAQDIKDQKGKVIIPANSTLFFTIKLVQVQTATISTVTSTPQKPDLKINGSDGPVTTSSATVHISWDGHGLAHCQLVNGKLVSSQLNQNDLPTSGEADVTYDQSPTGASLGIACKKIDGTWTETDFVNIFYKVPDTWSAKGISVTADAKRPTLTAHYVNLPTSGVQGIFVTSVDTGTNIIWAPIPGGTGDVSIQIPEHSPGGQYILRVLGTSNNIIAQSAPFTLANPILSNSAVPTCTAQVSKDKVDLGEVFTVSWTGTNAVSAMAQNKYADFPGLNSQDASLSLNGSASIRVGVPGWYTRDTYFFGSTQTSSTICSVKTLVTINHSTVAPFTFTADGQVIQTGSGTYDAAYSQCADIIKTHSSSRVKCEWSGTVILQNYGAWTDAG